MASPGLRVDGNDALAVYAASSWAADRARANSGPDADRALHLPRRGPFDLRRPEPATARAGEREEWPLGDPIARLEGAPRSRSANGTRSATAAMDAEIDAEQVRAAQKEAEKNGILGHGLHHPFHTMFEDVFEELPWHLEEQADAGDPPRRANISGANRNDARRSRRAAHQHDRGDQRRARHHAGARSRRRRLWARTSAISAACSAPPRACRRNTARPACSTRRSPNAGSSAPRSGWAPTACARCPRSSSPTTSTPARPAGQRGRAAALSLGRRVHRADGRAHALSAAASSAGRPTARAPRRCSPMSPG